MIFKTHLSSCYLLYFDISLFKMEETIGRYFVNPDNYWSGIISVFSCIGVSGMKEIFARQLDPHATPEDIKVLTGTKPQLVLSYLWRFLKNEVPEKVEEKYKKEIKKMRIGILTEFEHLLPNEVYKKEIRRFKKMVSKGINRDILPNL